MNPELRCNLCGKTNLALVERSIFYKGPDEYYVDKAAIYYRCSGCGKVLCKNCVNRLKISKTERHFLSSEKIIFKKII